MVGAFWNWVYVVVQEPPWAVMNSVPSKKGVVPAPVAARVGRSAAAARVPIASATARENQGERREPALNRGPVGPFDLGLRGRDLKVPPLLFEIARA